MSTNIDQNWKVNATASASFKVENTIYVQAWESGFEPSHSIFKTNYTFLPTPTCPLNHATRLEFSVIKGGIQYQRQLTTNPIIHTKSLSPSASEADTFSCNGWRSWLFRDAISASYKRSNSVNHVRLTKPFLNYLEKLKINCSTCSWQLRLRGSLLDV